MSGMSNYLEQKLLGVSLLGSAFTAVTTPYLSLATTVASDGDFFTEVATNVAYSRQPISFSAPTSPNDYSVVNSVGVAFTAATSTWGTVTHFGLHDGSVIGAGNLLYWGVLDTPRQVLTNDVFEVNAGQLSVRLD